MKHLQETKPCGAVNRVSSARAFDCASPKLGVDSGESGRGTKSLANTEPKQEGITLPQYSGIASRNHRSSMNGGVQKAP